jgi:LuxR family maltose regulon positive regulatory protein
MLDDLRRDSAFVERTGPGTYRIHGLLRTYLLTELARHRPHLHRALQQTAARWWAAADDPGHALRHADRAGEPTLAADLVRRFGIRLLARGETGAVRRALAAVDPARRSVDPWLALTAALLHLQEHAVEDAVSDLERARRVWPAAPEAELGVLRTAVELLVPGGRTDERPAPADRDVQVAPELDLLRRLGGGAARSARLCGMPMVFGPPSTTWWRGRAAGGSRTSRCGPCRCGRCSRRPAGGTRPW